MRSSSTSKAGKLPYGNPTNEIYLRAHAIILHDKYTETVSTISIINEAQIDC